VIKKNVLSDYRLTCFTEGYCNRESGAVFCAGKQVVKKSKKN